MAKRCQECGFRIRKFFETHKEGQHHKIAVAIKKMRQAPIKKK